MTVTISDILNANSVLTKILTFEFSAKQSFMIGRLLRLLGSESEAYEKTRQEMIKKYAEVDENNQIIIFEDSVKIREGEMENFQKEITELHSAELNIDAKPIPLDWLEDLPLTPAEMIALEPFILFVE